MNQTFNISSLSIIILLEGRLVGNKCYAVY